MKLIIDIDEQHFELLQMAVMNGMGDNAQKIIAQGTPLPKGHGRLIDADELKKIIEKNDPLSMAGFNVRLIDINSTPTIIEAESEVRNEHP